MCGIQKSTTSFPNIQRFSRYLFITDFYFNSLSHRNTLNDFNPRFGIFLLLKRNLRHYLLQYCVCTILSPILGVHSHGFCRTSRVSQRCLSIIFISLQLPVLLPRPIFCYTIIKFLKSVQMESISLVTFSILLPIFLDILITVILKFKCERYNNCLWTYFYYLFLCLGLRHKNQFHV